MNSLPKVSAALLVYRQRDFVAGAIDSILAQDYPNMEILIGDDGSTDGTQEILVVYREKYPDRIKLLLSDNNQGITTNCNKVLALCTGEYIAFLAGDDAWLPGKIAAQVEYMQKHPECSICYHNLELFDNESGQVTGLFNGAHNPPRTGGANVPIRYGCFNGALSNMVRRSKCPDQGFDPRIPIASDWLFWIETLRDGGEIHYLDEVLGRYRVMQGSMSNREPKKLLENFIDHLNTLNILLLKYPQYSEDIFFRMHEIFKILASIDPDHAQVYKRIHFGRSFRVLTIAKQLFGYIR